MNIFKEHSLRWQLVVLCAGLLIPALAFVGVLMAQYSTSERMRFEEEARSLARGLAVSLDREINGILTTLQALATSPSLQSGDLVAFYDQMNDIQRLQGVHISLRDVDGRTIQTTRAALGALVAVPPVLADTDREVLRTDAAITSNVFISTTSREPVFQIINAPVRVKGVKTYLLAASIDFDYLVDAIQQTGLPNGWVGTLIDRNGVFAVRTENQKDFVGKAAPASFQVGVIGEAGSYYGLNNAGTQSLRGYARSSLTQWTALATMSADVLNATLRRSLLLLLGLGVVLASCATVFAMLVGHHLNNAMTQLGAAANAIGQGRSVAPLATSITEVNAVGSALSNAARQLQERARQRDEAEAALREKEQTLRKLNASLEDKVAERTRERNRLWETTNDLVGIGSFEGYLKSINPAWTEQLGWTEKELLSRPFVDIVDPLDHPGLGAAVAELRAGRTLTGYVDRVVTKAGARRTVMWAAVPVLDEGVFYMVGRDLTDQRQAEETLHQIQKIEAIGQLTGGIAHDFNNMLAVIIGAINLLQRRLARGDINVTKYIDGALDGAMRAASLTHRLLAFSRQQPLAPETIDPNRMVADLTELLSRTLGEHNKIETVLSAGLWKAKADPSQLENVIINLCANARDAMPDGGKLTIETANAHIDSAYARDNDLDEGQYVMIAVSDTGMGMTSDVAAKAFDPFFTTKSVGKGTGLGLSQVFGFVRQSKGHVKIYSEVSHGTTIKLYLPRAFGEPLSTLEKTTPLVVQGGESREIILVVEDEDRVRNLAVETLRDLGYTVVHASNGEDALQMISTGQDVSLLFTDIVMPGMTGRQLVDAASTIRPNMTILYTTGYSRNAIVHNGVLDPGTNLLAKPFTIEQLAAAVRQTLDRSADVAR